MVTVAGLFIGNASGWAARAQGNAGVSRRGKQTVVARTTSWAGCD